MYRRYLLFVVVLLVIIFQRSEAQLIPELASSDFTLEPVDIEVEHTKLVVPKKPLKFSSVLSELVIVNQTGSSIIASPVKGYSGTVVKGGVLGDDVYEYFMHEFYWHDNASEIGHYSYSTVNGKGGTRLESLVRYFNKKYGSYENALKHADGITQVSFRVNVVAVGLANSLFPAFEHILGKMRNPGEHRCVLNGITFAFYVDTTPRPEIYYAYRGSYTDKRSGKIYPATTIVLPTEKYITLKQFKRSFGSLKDCSGKPLVNVSPQAKCGNLRVVRWLNLVLIKYTGFS